MVNTSHEFDKRMSTLDGGLWTGAHGLSTDVAEKARATVERFIPDDEEFRLQVYEMLGLG